MSAEEVSGKLKELPSVKEEHLSVLAEEGITTPEKLLAAMKDEGRWKELHPKLKGIGPKTAEKWIAALEIEIEMAEAPPKKKIERKVKAPAAKVKKVERKLAEEPEPKKKEEDIQEEPSEETAEEEEAEEEEIEEEEEEEAEVVEEGEYVPHLKPKLSEEVQKALRVRKEISDNRPKKFLRQEFHRYVRMRTGWRRPKGMHSKARLKMKKRVKNVSVGFGGPALAKGLHPSGFEEVKIFNAEDLDKITDSSTQAARIGHSVGQRKREIIIDKADELGIRVLNRS